MNNLLDYKIPLFFIFRRTLMYFMKYWFVLPSISVEVSVGEKESVAWQPISAISLQQSLNLRHCLSQ